VQAAGGKAVRISCAQRVCHICCPVQGLCKLSTASARLLNVILGALRTCTTCPTAFSALGRIQLPLYKIEDLRASLRAGIARQDPKEAHTFLSRCFALCTTRVYNELSWTNDVNMNLVDKPTNGPVGTDLSQGVPTTPALPGRIPVPVAALGSLNHNSTPNATVGAFLAPCALAAPCVGDPLADTSPTFVPGSRTRKRRNCGKCSLSLMERSDRAWTGKQAQM
jgi:hypothetical protein